MFTTLGRMFSIGCEPSDQMKSDWEAALATQDKLLSMLKIGMSPQVIFAQYNEYLEANGYKPEDGLFAYGLGYDHARKTKYSTG